MAFNGPVAILVSKLWFHVFCFSGVFLPWCEWTRMHFFEVFRNPGDVDEAPFATVSSHQQCLMVSQSSELSRLRPDQLLWFVVFTSVSWLSDVLNANILHLTCRFFNSLLGVNTRLPVQSFLKLHLFCLLCSGPPLLCLKSLSSGCNTLDLRHAKLGVPRFLAWVLFGPTWCWARQIGCA